MQEDTITALSQRDGAFWVALSLVFVGALLSNGSQVGDTLVGLGMGLLAVRVLVAFYRISRTSVAAGRVGYEEGKRAH